MVKMISKERSKIKIESLNEKERIICKRFIGKPSFAYHIFSLSRTYHKKNLSNVKKFLKDSSVFIID